MDYRVAISSASLGQACAGHSLEHRLDIASRHGFEGVALNFDDVAFVAQMLPDDADDAHSAACLPNAAQMLPYDPDDAVSFPPPPEAARHTARLLRAAAVVRDLCAARGLAVACLQPFRHLEGLRCRDAFPQRLAQLQEWCAVARALGTDLVVVIANELPAEMLEDNSCHSSDSTLAERPVDRFEGSSDTTLVDQPAELSDGRSDTTILADLRAAADTAHPVRLAYTASPAAPHVADWDRAWAFVRHAARPNLGLCLDVLHIVARLHDFERPAPRPRPLPRLVDAVDPGRLFFVQIADSPLIGVDLGRLRLVRQYFNAAFPRAADIRLFYNEISNDQDLCTVAAVVLRALPAGGWVGFDIRDGIMAESRPRVPEELAQRGAEARLRLQRDMRLEVRRLEQQEQQEQRKREGAKPGRLRRLWPRGRGPGRAHRLGNVLAALFRRGSGEQAGD